MKPPLIDRPDEGCPIAVYLGYALVDVPLLSKISFVDPLELPVLHPIMGTMAIAVILTNHGEWIMADIENQR